MRRIVGTFLILLFWAGPLAAILPGSAESRLPACCRRHGAHHCTMPGDPAAEQGDGSGQVFKAPSRCPQFPHAAAFTFPTLAFAITSANLPSPLVQILSPRAIQASARLSQLRVHADRGPPSPLS